VLQEHSIELPSFPKKSFASYFFSLPIWKPPEFSPLKNDAGIASCIFANPTHETLKKCKSNYTNEIGLVSGDDIQITISMPKRSAFEEHLLYSKIQLFIKYIDSR
jgi:hypothetical protein